MAGTSSPGQTNYWPAFVDALTNVVINLLFLMGLMALAFFVVSLQAEAARQAAPLKNTALPSGDEGGSTAKLQTTRPPRPDDVAQASDWGAFETLSVKNAADAESKAGAIRVAGLHAEANGWRGNLVFPAHRYAPQLPGDLLAPWTHRKPVAGFHWRLDARVAAENRASRRSGYVRLMAIRNLLLDLGARGEDIDVQLIEDGRAGPDDRVVSVTAVPVTVEKTQQEKAGS